MFGPSLLKTLMPLANGSYVPALRWRQAEYQALLRLKEPVKNSIVPLITIPPIEFDFETETLKKTVHEHVHPFVTRYVKKWGGRPSWLTLDDSIAGGRMNSGEHVFDYLLDRLRMQGALVIPALRLGADAETKVAAMRAVAWDKHGVEVIVRLEDLMGNDVGARVLTLVDELGRSTNETDVLIDMVSPNYEPYAAFAGALVHALGNMDDTDAFRNLVLVGTAIPESFASLAKGSAEIPRHDWLFYRVLLENLPDTMRRPTYGDHTITHPRFKAINLRAIQPSGKVVYTTPENWVIRKGGAFRDDRAQMHAHCSAIVTESRFGFRGGSFSYGDEYIEKCAAGAEGPSNLTRWKEVGISHHITAVVDDLAKLAAGSSTV